MMADGGPVTAVHSGTRGRRGEWGLVTEGAGREHLVSTDCLVFVYK